MSVITESELDKLSIMYDGDKNRDASDKIRGFLFQDYVTIMCLLQDDVVCVCSEYLEDVDVFFENGKFQFIQVKYYPKTNPNMKEISTDLYYQYLRLKMLHSNFTAIPSLYIHREQVVEKLTLDQMKTYIGLGDALQKTETYPNPEDSKTWLREQVYTANKKKEQKEKLFAKMASEQSIKEFVEEFDIFHQSNINQYKKELMEELAKAYPNPDQNGDEVHRQLILLGLAISYIQRRYILGNSDFKQLLVDKKEFNQYMSESIQTKTEKTITSYLMGIVCEKYGEIICHNDLSNLQRKMLNQIYQNTMRWINKIGENLNGQYQLLNTFSMDEVNNLVGYKNLSIDARLNKMAECKTGFVDFLGYLWKIMINICQEKVNDGTKNFDSLEWFDPLHYIVSSVTDYVCLNFPEDKYVNHSVILPKVGSELNSGKRKIIGRMINMSPKPGKWFFENSKTMKGKNYYNYSTANVNENPTVADLGEDSFYIECMDCIGIDEGEWSKRENCSNCIFIEKCVKEGL